MVANAPHHGPARPGEVNHAGAAAAYGVDATVIEPRRAATASAEPRIPDDWCKADKRGLDWLIGAVAAALQGDAMSDTLGGLSRRHEELLVAAKRDSLASWIRALRAQGDQRALALAEYLAGKGEVPDTSSAARLQAMAQRSTDPMITALALQHACELRVCTNVDAAQWSRLEPANVLAWAALTESHGSPSVLGDYPLERAAAEARYYRDYAEEALSLLKTVLAPEASALQAQAEVELLGNIEALLRLPSLRGVTQRCLGMSTDTRVRARRCEAVADMLWTGNNEFVRSFALRLAGESVPISAPGRQVWERRAREFEAVSAHLSAQRSARMDEWLPDDVLAAMCQGPIKHRQWMMRAMATGEWQEAQASLPTSSAEREELVKRWREREGRNSALEPRPKSPRPAASAAPAASR